MKEIYERTSQKGFMCDEVCRPCKISHLTMYECCIALSMNIPSIGRLYCVRCRNIFIDPEISVLRIYGDTQDIVNTELYYTINISMSVTRGNVVFITHDIHPDTNFYRIADLHMFNINRNLLPVN